MRYLIDTNIVIYYFNGLIADEQIHALLAQDFTLSVITKIEFWGGVVLQPMLLCMKKPSNLLATLRFWVLPMKSPQKPLNYVSILKQKNQMPLLLQRLW